MTNGEIILYAEKDTLCSGFGIAVLDNYIVNPVITETLNSNFTFEFEMPSEKANIINNRMIIKAPTPQGNELFRVRMIEKRLEGSNLVFFYCTQVFFCDMEDNFIEDTNIVDKTGYFALEQMQSNTQYSHNFNFYSDISISNSSRMVRKNFVTALIGEEDNSFINRWGGELEVNKFDVKMLTKRGEDRGVSILYKKNLTGLNAKIDYSTYYTRVMPQGFNGLFLENKYVDSPNIDLEHPIIRVVEFPDIKVKENEDDDGYATIEEAREALKEAGEKLFSISKVDEPDATYTVEFQELSQTEEYKNYSILEKIYLGDIVHVKHEGMNINVTARCLEYRYDPLNKSFIDITLGNITESFSSEVTKKQEEILEKVEVNKNDFQNKLKDAVEHLTNLINSGLYGHVIINPNEILIMDTTDITTAVEVWRYNINGFGYSNTGYNGEFIGLTKDGKLVINEATAYKFTASLIESGIIKGINGSLQMSLEDDYFQLSHNEGTTQTRIDEQGFYILDENNETIASLASKESWTELKADKVFASNVDNSYVGDSNIYVNHNYTGESNGTVDKPFKSYSDLKLYLDKTKIINKNLVINVISEGDCTDNLLLGGFYGTGTLTINFNAKGRYQGTANKEWAIKLINIKIPVLMQGKALFNGFPIGARFENCEFVSVENMIFNTTSFGCYYDNSDGKVCSTDFADSFLTIYADNCSRVYTHTTAGNGKGERFRVRNGGTIIFGANTTTSTAKGVDANYGGLIQKVGEVIQVDSWSFPPTNPVPSVPSSGMSYNQVFNYTSLATYQYSYNNWKSGECKSGVYSSYGDKAGHIFFDLTAIRNFLNNGTVVDGATITLTRANSGGTSAATNISVGGSSCGSASGTPSYSNKGNVGSLKWGETQTFILNKAIVEGIKNGTINSITTHGSGYTNITACSINLKIQK